MSRMSGAGDCEHDVAVIGAGPAGSGMAAALASRGWRVLLIERDRFPRHKVCGEFLSPEAQDTLHELSLYDELASLGPISLSHAVLISGRGTRLRSSLPKPGWGISRFTMDRALADAAIERGVTLWHKSTVVDLEVADSRTVVIVRRGSLTVPVQVRIAILAGGRALSSRLVTQSSRGRSEGLNVGVKAHFRGIAMPNEVEIYLFDGGYVGINPVADGVANVCLLISYPAFCEAGRNPSLVFEWVARRNHSFGARLASARVVADTLCSVAGVDTGRPSRPWQGLPLLGDSAAMIPPLCGDGMAMALHSAVLCVPYADAYLRGKSNLAAWQNGYVESWHTAFGGRLRTGRILQAMLNSRASDLLLRAGRMLPPVADYFVRATRGPLAHLPADVESSQSTLG